MGADHQCGSRRSIGKVLTELRDVNFTEDTLAVEVCGGRTTLFRLRGIRGCWTPPREIRSHWQVSAEGYRIHRPDVTWTKS